MEGDKVVIERIDNGYIVTIYRGLLDDIRIYVKDLEELVEKLKEKWLA